MAAKIHEYGDGSGPQRLFVFHCPGCKFDHPFHTGGDASVRPQWDWNGSIEVPTFTPSLMCNRGHANQCHSNVTDGKITFHGDSWHELKGQTLELPDWEGW